MGQQLSILRRLPFWLQVAVGLCVVGGALLARHFRKLSMHPANNLPGPKPAHRLVGDLDEMYSLPTGEFYKIQRNAHGPVWTFSAGVWKPPAVVVGDLRALAYVYNNSDMFHKSEDYRFLLYLMGEGGLVGTEGDTHRRQRRVINPAFGGTAIQDLTPGFIEQAAELRDYMLRVIEGDEQQEGSRPPKPQDMVPGARKIEISKPLTDLSFNIMGISAFDTQFNVFDTPHPAVAKFRKAFSSLVELDLLLVLQLVAPIFDIIPSKRVTDLKASMASIMELGEEMVQRKKEAILASEGSIDKSTNIPKDVPSLIVKANMAKDLPENQRLTHDEIKYQISTFMVGGTETTANSLTWCLYHLAQNPGIQSRLRNEAFTLGPEPTFEELNGLPFLENVIREILRLEPPVPTISRVTAVNTVIPLEKPLTGKDGTLIHVINAPKGTEIFLPNISVNRDKELFGADAEDFNPDRWDRPNYPSEKMPGVWGSSLSFSGGWRACVGYRFALAEMKAVLFTLMRGLEFELLPSKPEIIRRDFSVMLPWVAGEEKNGSQMPLLVRAYHAEH